MSTASLHRTTSARIPTVFGQFQLCHFLDSQNEKEHLALVLGDIEGKRGVVTRVHSECFTGDVLGSLRCDCGEQLQTAMRLIAEEGSGLIIYLRQEGRGIGLEHKLLAYNLQDQGFDTVDANLMLGHQADEREYSAAAAILADLQIQSIRLLTNNPDKIESLQQLGIVIDARMPLESSVHQENAGYLATKVQRMRHLLSVGGALPPAINGEHTPSASTQIDLDRPHAAPANGRHEPQRDGPHQQLVAQCAAWQSHAEAHARNSHRPFVTLTYAQTLDGSIAGPDNQPLQISGPESMRMTHMLRTRHDAILVGIGTVLADNPRLTARLVEGRQPQPIVLDTHLRMPRQASLFQHPKGVWLATHLNGNRNHDNFSFEPPSAKLIDIPLNRVGQLDLTTLLNQLGDMGISRLMVEGGSGVIRSFLRARLVDYMIITIAPSFAGGRNVLTVETTAPALATEADSTRAVTARPVVSDVPWPTLAGMRLLTAGQDMVVWGVPTWARIGEETPPVSTQINQASVA